MRLTATFQILIALLLAAGLAPSSALAQSLTIQGRVQDSSGNPLTGAATQFRVQILSPDANRCVLYDETQTVDLSQTNGLFSINLNNGSGTINAPASYSLNRAISNLTGFSVSSSYCQSGSGTVSYVPSATDNRKVVIQFRDPGSMSSFEKIPEMDLNPVAYAMDARSVGGYPASSLLRVIDSGTLGTPASFTSAQFTELQSLIAGSSTNYMSTTAGSTTGARLPTVGGNPSAPTAGSIWFDTTSGTMKYYDGSAVQSVGSGGGGSGTITGITASGALTGGGTSGAVTISLPATGVTGAGVAVGSASSIPVIKYDAYGRLTEVTSAAISGTLPTGTAGQFLKSAGGSSWAGSGILMGDLKNGTGSLPLFGTVNCSASQSMYWDSGADQIRCQNISIGNSQISDVAWGKITGVPNLVANAGGTPSLLTDTEANLPSVHVAGRIFFASDTKKIFRDNGTSWDQLAVGGTGTLTDVLSGAGISVSGTGATRTVALDNTGKAAGTFYKVTTDADGRVSSGAGALVAADIPALDWSKITTGKPDFVLNALNTASFTTGPTSALPAGHSAGRVFIDTTTQKIQYDDGTNWIVVASNGGAGFAGSLAGEVSGTQGATQLDSINGITRSTITSNLNAVSNATDLATASRLVKRDANGDFAGRKITSGEFIVKGTNYNVSFITDPTASYTLKLPSTAPAANQILQSDASGVLSWINPFSGAGISVSAPVTNTSGTIGMPSANTSRDGYLTQADWNTFSGKLSSALNSALIWVGNGSNVATPVAPSGNVTVDNTGKFTVTGIRDQSISAAGSATGQILRYASANTWTPQFLSMGDLRSTVTGTQALTTGCTASQTLTWNSGTDSLQCQSISIAAASQITGVLPIANGGTGASSTSQSFVFAGPSSGAGAPAFRALTAADISGVATTASPAFTGTPTAPTAAADTNTTQLATTAFVLGQASNSTPLMNGTAAIGTSLRYARADHVHPVDTSRAPAAGSSSITTVGTITSGTWAGSTIDVARGGTGLTSGTANGVLYFSSSSTITSTAGTSGQVLSANASGVPTWTTPSWLTGSGTTNYLTKFTGTGTIGQSAVYENSGSVGIGTSSPAASAALDVNSTTAGFLPPRLTTTQRNAVASPTAGLVIYNATSNQHEFYNGSAWVSMGGLPNGAIAAFAATSCPTGWVEYTAARGRYLRGIDNGAGLDPDGTRTPGSVQADDFKSHAHTATAANAGSHAHTGTTDGAGAHAHSINAYYPNGTGVLTINDYSTDAILGTDNATGGFSSTTRGTESAGNHNHSFTTAANGDHTHAITVAANGGTETRGKNVAVLYCQYQGGNTGATPPTLAALGGVNISSPTNGQSLVYNSTSGKWENQAVAAAAAGPSTTQFFTSSGSFTVPAGITKIKVVLMGGGGGGYSISSCPAGSYGGASGGYCESYLSVTPGAVINYTVGAGGAAASAGGTTTFSTLSATGGAPSGGAGGTTSGCQMGVNGFTSQISGFNSIGYTGASGANSFKGYGQGGVFVVASAASNWTQSGNPAQGFGAGGGAATCQGSGSGAGAGGAGAPGFIQLEY